MSINGVHGEHDEPVPGPTTQRDELRHRIFEIIHVRTCEECQVENDDGTPQGAFAAADAVLAVRDDELEELRTAAQYNQDRLVARAKAAETKLAAVRELHRPESWHSEVLDCVIPGCSACGSGDYPCPTIRALDGDGE